jgi:CHAD domain-containing protein
MSQASITAHSSTELAQARQAAVDALGGQRYLLLLEDLDAMLADPPLTPLAERKAGKALPEPVRRTARRLRRALVAVPGAEDRDVAIHEARKAAKRARYAAEAAGSWGSCRCWNRRTCSKPVSRNMPGWSM